MSFEIKNSTSFSVNVHILILKRFRVSTMFATKAAVLLGLVGIAIATDCISDMGKRCKPKSEVNPYWASKYATGDPCFLDNNKRVSNGNFINTVQVALVIHGAVDTS